LGKRWHATQEGLLRTGRPRRLTKGEDNSEMVKIPYFRAEAGFRNPAGAVACVSPAKLHPARVQHTRGISGTESDFRAFLYV
jgi:hypothetical protein